MKKTIRKTQRFDSLSIKLASPEEVLSWSFGEVIKPETINYRTQRPERDGLFCEKIFGPENDFQCSCGKYKGIQYQGIECSSCGVEVTRAIVRRDRMGHIDLAVPVAHYWFLRKVPSKIATLLGVPTQQIQNVIYFSAYYITDVSEEKRKKLSVDIKKEFDEKIQKSERQETHTMLQELYADRINDLNLVQKGSIIEEIQYETLSGQFPGLFKAEKGGEVVYNLLKQFDLKKKEKEVVEQMETAGKMQQEKLQKQLLLVRSFIQSGNRPEWMFVKRLPVIPPGIRPVLLLDSGQPVSSDLNDLYRGIIIRNNRLKEFIAAKTPQIFINTEKRLLQEAVDALFEKTGTDRGFQAQGRGRSRQLKPISEYLGGKSGYFRTNLLGKRVDFTGRSVIVGGPHLKLDEFGLPKKMALEIFRPFVIGEILARELAFNVRGAQRLIDTGSAMVWEILEKVTADKYMLLNRAPTLHRQSIMAFRPILIEGLAIEINPLVCAPYNADFDGDTMTVYLPLSEEAQAEARHVIVSKNNIATPASGEINITPARYDILLGCYWATVNKEGAKGDGRYFGSISEAITAYDNEIVDLRACVHVLTSDKEKYGEYRNKVFQTTVGRLLFNTTLPKDYPFVNETVNKGILNAIIEKIMNTAGKELLAGHLDAIKEFGFKYATKSGISFPLDELQKPEGRDQKIAEGRRRSEEIVRQYEEGYLSLGERKRKTVEMWEGVKKELIQELQTSLATDSSIGNMVISKSRGSFNQISEMSAMFGVVETASGEAIEQPITSSLKEGLSPIEYFTASFGARKGLADSALKTADAGFLSRKLFSVAHEVRIEGEECGTVGGFRIYRKTASGVEVSFADRIQGRFAAEEVVGTKEIVVVKKRGYISLEIATAIEEDEAVTSVKVRSPVSCAFARGICAKCYGKDHATGEIVDIGESVGTIAAQSVGEPGTQLTMRTFHKGGVATAGGDITAGLPRVTEIFENRSIKSPAIIARVNGTVESIESLGNEGGAIIHLLPDAKKTTVAEKRYAIPPSRFTEVAVGDVVKKGQFLTDGSADLRELLLYAGKEKTQEYIFGEVAKIYELQGVLNASVHLEIIIRQMFSNLVVTDPGDGFYTTGESIELGECIETNEQLKQEGKKVVKAEDTVSGITNISVSRNNFLSAASFQNTTSVLIRASISGAKDTLDGVKENVVVGRLVPVGSGYKGSKKYELVEEVKEAIKRRLAQKEESTSY